jgi:cardiolipin synthase (CMP-forming)
LHYLPNALSFLRILMTPLIVAAIFNGLYDRALVLCLIAGWTDAFDGWTARWLKVESKFGQVLDPVADKVMQVGVFLALGITGLAPVWVVVIVFGRDLLIIAMATLFLISGRRGEFPPSIWGKISTIIQIATAAFVLGRVAAPWEPFGLAMTAVTTVWSGLHYCWRALVWIRTPQIDHRAKI